MSYSTEAVGRSMTSRELEELRDLKPRKKQKLSGVGRQQALTQQRHHTAYLPTYSVRPSEDVTPLEGKDPVRAWAAASWQVPL